MKMKKLFCIALALCMVLALAACGGNNKTVIDVDTPDYPASGTDIASPEAGEPDNTESGTRRLVVGFDAEFPPFGFISESGDYDGFDLAVAKELCNRLGWEFECIAIDWNSKDAELSSGNIDCVWNGFTCSTPERVNAYTWSDPYVDNSIVVVVAADSGITSLEDLAGKSVMVQAASSGADALNGEDRADFRASLAEVVELPDYNQGFMELDMGTVSAVIADIGVAKYQMSMKDGEYIILEEAVSTEQYAVGFLLGNTELRDLVNAELLAMAQDGTMLRIAENYVDKGLVIDSLCMINR